jgi:hypothetical protein
MKRYTLFIFILLSCIVLPAVELKKIDTVLLAPGEGDDLLAVAAPFGVTEDGLYLVPDRKAGDIKVFDLKGRFVKRVGRRGFGPNELVEPRNSDYLGSRYVVLDMGRRQYTLYQRDKKTFLKEIKRLRSVYMGNDVTMMGDDQALIAGYVPGKDGTHWECYTYDFNTGQYNYLVDAATKFGFSSHNEYHKARKDISIIGSQGYCDWWGDYAYLVWRGNLRILKTNMKTKEMVTFGKKTDNYHQPVATERKRKALQERNLLVLGGESGKVSNIMGLYTNKNYLLLMYNRPLVKGEEVNSRMLQFYTLDGTFIDEKQITHGTGCALYLSKDRDDHILYMLHPGKDDDYQEYLISRFKIVK